FRKGRSCQDACEYIFTALSRKASPQWILEGDIKGCFDNISHDWLLENIPMDKSILKQFLKAGFVFKGELFPTEDGTPQGGIISPILANMALDGLQQVLSDRFHTNRLGKVDLRFKNSHKVNLVRYADDFIVTAATQEIALEAKELIREFLLGRGLELSEEKTLVTHINDGFDLLGWNFRKYKGKLIVKPSKNSIQTVIGKFSETILKRGKAWEQEVLIMKLNQQIRGWTNYHQSVCASEAFSYLDYQIYELLWRWAKRRHPKKGQWWISTKYWHRRSNRSWVFASGDKELIRVDHTAIVRHTKVRENANPYLDTDYFAQRTFNHGMKRLTGRFKLVWKKQNGRCHHCGLPMELGEDREIFFKVPKSKGGVEEIDNMAYVHRYCQRLFIESRSKE
ncbi:TPA: group II intron reverse transcriptase, partial [Streptococcus agalactiae]